MSYEVRNGSEELELKVYNVDEEGINNNKNNDNVYGDNENDKLLLDNRRNKKKERLYWVDALRIFASYLVVLIHCSYLDHKESKEVFSAEWAGFYFFYCVLKPCVPLFMMISGLLFLDPNRTVSLSSLYKKSIPRLLKGYFFWSVYYTIVDRLIVNLNHNSFSFDWSNISKLMMNVVTGKDGNHLWYIQFCLGLYMYAPVYREMIPNKTLSWYTACISCICYHFIPTVIEFVQTFISPLNDMASTAKSFLGSLRLYPFTGCITYFMFGYLLNANTFTEKKYIYPFYILGIFGFIITPILMFSSCHVAGKETRKFGDYMNFNVCIYSIGIFMFFKYTVNDYLQKLIKMKSIKKVITVLSDCSFGIYLLHYHVYHVLIKINFHPQIIKVPLLFAPFYAFVVFSISFICIYMMRKIRLLKQFT